MEWIEKDLSDVCLLPKPKDTFFPEVRSNPHTHILCNKLGGHMSVADGQEKQEILFEELKKKIPSWRLENDYRKLVSCSHDYGFHFGVITCWQYKFKMFTFLFSKLLGWLE